MSRRRQDPWSNDPIVGENPPPQQQALTPNQTDLSVREVVRRPDGSSYAVTSRAFTNETPEELRAQGFEQDAEGTWFKTVGAANLDGPAQADPWAADPVLTDSQIAADAEAQRRINLPGGALRSGKLAATQGVTLGFADEIGGYAAQLGQMGKNLVRRASGDEIEINSADLRNSMTQGLRAEGDRFARERPVSNIGLQALGGLATGGVGAARAGVVNAARVGAGYGAAYGAGSAEGGFADRLQGAAVGGVVGGLTGGAVQGGANAAAPYASRLMGIVGNATRPARETMGRMIPGGARGAPEQVAAQRLVGQLERQGLTPDQIGEEVARYRQAGLEPSIVDVGGENLRATVRAAASGEGPGRQLAVDYADGVRSSVAPRAIERARRLTSDPRDALEAAGTAVAARRNEARQLYGDAYSQEITVPVEIVGALRGPEGQAAIQQARRIAVLERDEGAIRALDNLATADFDQAVTANGKALDYVRQAYADMARDAEGNLGNALRGRVDEIETGLDLIPELQTARSAYKARSQEIDALGGAPNSLGRQQLGRPDRAPQNVLTTDATRYAAYVDGLPENAQGANQLFQRDRIIESLGRARDGSVGPLNALSAGRNLPAGPNAPIVARNLEATFPGQGQQFQQDIGLARQQVSAANFIDPNTGSQTAPRLADAAGEGAQQIANVATGGKAAVLRIAFDNMRRRAGLNEAEREAVVSLGIGSADELERIVALAQAARQANRPPPREVRAYITRARNTLGAQSPVIQQVETLLLPAPVSAEEQQ